MGKLHVCSGVVARLGDHCWQDFACGMNARLGAEFVEVLVKYSITL